MATLTHPDTTRSNNASTVACRGGSGCDSTAWLVTAAHDTPRGLGDRGPWGMWHVKRNGALQTACGMSTVNWHMYWEMEIASSPRACRKCMRIVNLSRAMARNNCA